MGLSIGRRARKLEDRSGRTAWLGALALAVALGLGLTWVFRSTSGDPQSALPTPRTGGSSSELVGAAPSGSTAGSPVELRRSADVDSPTPRVLTPEQRTARFDGVGRLRGSLRTDPPNLPLPERWTIALEPSRSLVTTVRVERRELVCGSDGRFVFEHVPLGGYDLVVDAGELDCPRQPVLLAKPESQDVFLVVVARLAGELRGRVLDASGLGAEGLALALVSVDIGRELECTTGPGGEYRFERVHDGEWRLCAGSVTNPLLPVRDVAFRGPRLTMPDLELPPCGALEVLVHDERGVPVEGASVAGYGPRGGAPRATTDVEGKARLAWLPAGEFTVLVEHAGRSASKQLLTIVADETASTRFVVVP